MSREAPWFKFFAARWLGDRHIKYMSAEQRGFLINLMCEAWESEPAGTLPADPTLLWRMAGARSRKQFERIGGPVLQMFELHDGRHFCSELVEQHEGLAAMHESRRKAAMAGARAKWSKPKPPPVNLLDEIMRERSMDSLKPEALPTAVPSASQPPAYQNKREKEQKRSDAFPGTFRWEIEQKRTAAQADIERFQKTGGQHGR